MIDSKKNIFKETLFSGLISLFPLSFIAGNLIINLNILILVLLSLFIFKKELFKIKYYFLDKALVCFFLLIIFTGVYNDIEFYIYDSYPKGINSTLKSLFYLKYLLLYLSLRFLIEKKLISLKIFFISCSFFSILVSLDIIFQFFYGKDIFGYEAVTNTGGKLGGPFGNEYIAGGYIQRFCLFAFFLFPFLDQNKKKYYKYLLIILFLVFLSAIIFSGNRMPVILYIFMILLILTFSNNLKKFIIPTLFLFTIIFYSAYKYDTVTRVFFDKFYAQVTGMINPIIKQDFYNQSNPIYLKEFVSSYDTWRLNKYIGGGIKNFRYYCHHRSNIDTSRKIICNMHPHNYYLEILTETGVVGFIISILIFLNILYISFYKKYFTNSNLKTNSIIIPFIFLLIIEIFPIKSTGSFFTTGVATYFFLIFGIIVGLVRRENSIDNEKQRDKLI